MAITYSNTIYDDIMENLATLINDEFSIAVYYDEHKHPQSFVLIPTSDELVVNLSSGTQREYEIEDKRAKKSIFNWLWKKYLN